MDSTATRVKLSAYRGLFWVFLAGAIGISLLCSVSRMALQDLNIATAMALEPADVFDSVVSNLNTAAAMTLQAFSELEATSTPTRPPTSTFTIGPTSTVSKTPFSFPFPTLGGPTNTRRPRPDPITNTPIPQPTDTPIPTNTRTPIPTNTPVPTETNTPVPPDTDTPIPPDTDTPTSEPTNTPGIPITGESPTPGP